MFENALVRKSKIQNSTNSINCVFRFKHLASDNAESDEQLTVSDSSLEDVAGNQKQIGPNLWKDVPVQNVSELPQDVNGLSVYQIDNVDKNGLVAALKDGRKWKKNGPSKWKGHLRVRYSDCRGSYACQNDDCTYKKRYGVQNNTQFDKNGKYTACDHAGDCIPCDARRYISYGKTRIRVYHCREHQCPVYTKTSEKNLGKIRDMIKKSHHNLP